MPDSDLLYISNFCVSLHYLNLKGCISVTDVGISNLICRCVKLHSILVCDTSFGINSILALCSASTNFGASSATHFGKRHSNTLAYKLQTLHMGGCKGGYYLPPLDQNFQDETVKLSLHVNLNLATIEESWGKVGFAFAFLFMLESNFLR